MTTRTPTPSSTPTQARFTAPSSSAEVVEPTRCWKKTSARARRRWERAAAEGLGGSSARSPPKWRLEGAGRAPSCYGRSAPGARHVLTHPAPCPTTHRERDRACTTVDAGAGSRTPSCSCTRFPSHSGMWARQVAGARPGSTGSIAPDYRGLGPQRRRPAQAVHR
ncbi:MAG: hypothetical protein M0C28_40710 [Candidatus Moduliflexus flocculans]|nr:hypothetical protein [Candidatus Moduliflexus flocculans]